jgi:beta-lactamase class D|tara:strand:+ start:210 stop:809 length:600 start_codon:yes stop_codon:yes gene_type:complete
MNKPNYYAIIPAEVRYSDLKPNAKLLYGEITALSGKLGYCYATNNYFAELYGVSKNTISSWISDLKKLGFINVIIERNSNKQIIKRCIGITKKIDTPILKKMKGNNTSINNTSNINITKEKFIAEVMTFDYPEDMLEDFINYWTEGKKKMRYQKQSTFEIKLRLLRWEKNQKKFENNKTKTMSKLDSQINAWQEAKKLL